MIEQKLTPSLVVGRVIPDYVVQEFPKFVSFIRAYYKFLEQDGELIGRMNKFLSNQDIHTVTDSDSQYKILSMFLESIPKNLEIDYAILLQNIRKFYASKGTEGSIKTFLYLMSEARKPNTITIAYTGNAEDLIGQTITGTSSGAEATILRATLVSGSSQYVVINLSYTSTKKFFNSSDQIKFSDGDTLDIFVEDFNVDIFYPKEYMIRTSDGKYTSSRRCRIRVPEAETSKTFQNLNFVNGSGSVGRIERATYTIAKIGADSVFDLVLSFSRFKGWADENETLTIDGKPYELMSVFAGISIHESGLGYSVGDTFPVYRGTQKICNLVVDGVGKGNVSSILVSNGGTGYTLGDKFSFVYSDGTYGGGWVTSVVGGVITAAKVYHSRKFSTEYPSIVFASGNSTATLYPITTSTGSITSAYFDDVLYDLDGSEYVQIPTNAVYLTAAQITPIVGTLYTTKKRYENTKGQTSSSHKIQDSYYWQDFSYVLKLNKSIDFSEMSDLYNKVVHPAGTKVFIEYQKLPSKISIDRKMNVSHEQHLVKESPDFESIHERYGQTIGSVERIKDTSPLQYFSFPFFLGDGSIFRVSTHYMSFEEYTMKLSDINSPTLHKYNNVIECYPFVITIGS